MQYVDTKLTETQHRVINWVINNSKEYNILCDNGIYSGDIVNYIDNNNSKNLPIEWVIKLLMP